MKIISLTQRSFQNAVREAAETIMRGGVVLAPTDTVYGLIANMADRKAIQKIYSIKKRDSQKPLPVFVKSIVAAKKLAAVSQKNEAFLETAWPGKITAILARKKDQKIFGVAAESIALRIPHYHFINSLLETMGLPLSATSANISGRFASVKIDEVLEQLNGSDILPDLVINAGDLVDSMPSMIIDLTGLKPTTLRQ